jgi:hypothetical protein
MLEDTRVTAPVKASPTPPYVTRGLRRHQEKLLRRREQVPADALVVGIDLARERQAVSYVAGREVLGRRRLSCEPHELDRVLDEAQALASERGSSGVVVAFEPAGHYWCLAAEAFERSGTPYVLVQPLSVKRAWEESRYTPEKTDPRDADLIGQLATQGRFTDTQLSSSHDDDAAGRSLVSTSRCAACRRRSVPGSITSGTGCCRSSSRCCAIRPARRRWQSDARCGRSPRWTPWRREAGERVCVRPLRASRFCCPVPLPFYRC